MSTQRRYSQPLEGNDLHNQLNRNVEMANLESDSQNTAITTHTSQIQTLQITINSLLARVSALENATNPD